MNKAANIMIGPITQPIIGSIKIKEKPIKNTIKAKAIPPQLPLEMVFFFIIPRRAGT